jgi:cytochrome c556
MCRSLAAIVAMACLLGLGTGMCEAQTRKKEAEKFENQKAVMKEMGPCVKEMMALRDKLEKEKMFSAQAKLRKEISAQGERMAELTEAWKPFVKGDKATKLQEDMLKASTELAKVGKSGGKKATAVAGVTAVQTACGECHKGYKPKEGTGEETK